MSNLTIFKTDQVQALELKDIKRKIEINKYKFIIVYIFYSLVVIFHVIFHGIKFLNNK
jgi:nitrogen fixation/metabolism regulation signal transduction histidine kinase